eukprot:TRINITY_DN9132_c0_g1_i2.p1 TRINITY_DN9132_c0_g1~~TRINITY_DN9132_c0_g1_i2.p1  ORF type:complete len:389 (+),score=77.01 TRINITY_DN9132_c0_g1_i2:83-1168(+)
MYQLDVTDDDDEFEQTDVLEPEDAVQKRWIAPYQFDNPLRRASSVYAVYCLKCKMALDFRSEAIAFVPKPTMTQSRAKGASREWRVATDYNEVYLMLALDRGQGINDDDKLPDPNNMCKCKEQDAAVERVKNVIACVAQAAQFTHAIKDMPMATAEQIKQRLDVQTPPELPVDFKKLLASDTSPLFDDVRIKLLAIHEADQAVSCQGRNQSTATRAASLPADVDDDSDDLSDDKHDASAKRPRRDGQDEYALVAKRIAAERAQAAKWDAMVLSKLDDVIEVLKTPVGLGSNDPIVRGWKLLADSLTADADRAARQREKDARQREMEGRVNWMRKAFPTAQARLQAKQDGSWDEILQLYDEL